MVYLCIGIVVGTATGIYSYEGYDLGRAIFRGICAAILWPIVIMFLLVYGLLYQ